MKRPVKRVSLLVDVLNDFLQVEGILLKVELNNSVACRKADAAIQRDSWKATRTTQRLDQRCRARTSGCLNSRELACSLVVLRRGG
jgi:hypothetical protein